jgi:hypothetical protein
MSRSKKLYILLGVLVVISVITLIVSRVEQKQEEIKNSDETILAIPSDDVTVLSWKTEDASFAFHKDGTWLYDEDEAFPVDQEEINTLLSMFEDFGVSFIIENVDDFGQYGLDNPVGTIHLETADETYEISLGGYSTMDSERYVSIGDGNVYLVKTDPYDSFDIEISALIDNDEIPDISDATKISYSGTESGDVIYNANLESDCADDVYYTTVNSEKKPLDTTRVNSYLSTLRYMDLTDYVTYAATSDDLATYGLSDPELTLVISYTDEDDASQTLTLTFGRDEEQKQAAVDALAKAEADGDAADGDSADTEGSSAGSTSTDTSDSVGGYVRVNDSAIVYALSASDYEAAMAISYNDLRHENVFTADFAEVDKLEVTLDGETYTFLASGDTDSRTYTYLEKEIDMTDIESSLTALSADSFTDEKPSGTQEITLTLYRNADTEDESTSKIALYRYSGSECLAVKDGESFGFVDRSSVTDLTEAVYKIVLN